MRNRLNFDRLTINHEVLMTMKIFFPLTTSAEKGLHRHTLRVLVAYLFSMLLKSIKLEPQHLQKKLNN